MKVLVTGATGFLGAHLIEALLTRGHIVRVLARRSSRTETLEAKGIEIVRGGFDESDAVKRAVDGVEAIVHAAGGGVVSRPELAYEGNTRSTEALVAAAAAVRRFVLVSSLAAHGPSPAAQPDDESKPDAPRSEYGKSKLAAEKAVLASSYEAFILRPPALYGPGEHRMVGLFKAARRGVVPMVHPSGTLSMLHGADCADAVAAALEATTTGGVYFVAEEAPYRRADMARIIGRAVGRDVRVLGISTSVMFGIGATVELYGRLSGRAVMLSTDKAKDATQPHQTCNPARAIAELGWRPTRRFETSAAEVYAGYLERGWL